MDIQDGQERKLKAELHESENSTIKAGRQECLSHPHNGFLIVSTLPRLPLGVVGASLVGARSPATKMIAQPVILSDVNESLSNRGHCLC